MSELKCRNCEEDIKTAWERCPSCGADLKKGKYSATDDPLAKVKADVEKIKKHLEDEHAKKEDNPDAKKTKSKLFGD